MIDSPCYFLYDDGGPFAARCSALCAAFGLGRAARPEHALFSLAPCWRRRIPTSELLAPASGVLVFHPSPLPHGRGPDAIRAAVSAGERVGAATWFWASEGLDEGDLCEQEFFVLDPSESPGRAYHTRYVPAGVRSLSRAVCGIIDGCPRRVRQDSSLASWHAKRG